MYKIEKIAGRQILDSRGNPTIEVDVELQGGGFGRAAVPSGASTGIHEAHELRDGDKEHYLGKGVLKAIANVEGEIAENLIGVDLDQEALDRKLIDLDGTDNKERLGANAILGVSMAFAWAVADHEDIPLFKHIQSLYGSKASSMPRPMFNIMNGGKHANWSTDIQEFMIIINRDNYLEQLESASEVFHHLGELLEEKGLNTNIGNEGGYAPGFSNNEQALEAISEAVSRAGFKLGEDVSFALDVAASEFYNKETGGYTLKTEDKEVSAEEWKQILGGWMDKYPLISIEDPFSEDDWDNWVGFTAQHGADLQIVGDDLLVTNTNRIEKAIEISACNCLLVKVNQIGTLTETFAAMHMAEQAGWKNVVSHRSGETEDITISHIVVGTAAGQIKTGAPSRGERTAKFNELIRIGEQV